MFYLTECGIRAVSNVADRQHRIVNGRAATQGEWPWVVNLQADVPGHDFPKLCAGTLINNFWILTAWHCFVKEK